MGDDVGAYVAYIYPGSSADQLHGELQEGKQGLWCNQRCNCNQRFSLRRRRPMHHLRGITFFLICVFFQLSDYVYKTYPKPGLTMQIRAELISVSELFSD